VILNKNILDDQNKLNAADADNTNLANSIKDTQNKKNARIT
jgi:hypothetical protein